MLTPELMDRVQLLQADLAQVRQQSQARGSGATIHRVSNQVATAQSTLQFVATRCDETNADDIEPPAMFTSRTASAQISGGFDPRAAVLVCGVFVDLRPARC